MKKHSFQILPQACEAFARKFIDLEKAQSQNANLTCKWDYFNIFFAYPKTAGKKFPIKIVTQPADASKNNLWSSIKWRRNLEMIFKFCSKEKFALRNQIFMNEISKLIVSFARIFQQIHMCMFFFSKTCFYLQRMSNYLVQMIYFCIRTFFWTEKVSIGETLELDKSFNSSLSEIRINQLKNLSKQSTWNHSDLSLQWANRKKF